MTSRENKVRKLLPCKYKGDQFIRRDVFIRDNFTCKMCGVRAIDIPEKYDGRYALYIPGNKILIVDHIIPWKSGGTIDIENLQTLCEPCNMKKGNRIFPAGLSVRDIKSIDIKLFSFEWNILLSELENNISTKEIYRKIKNQLKGKQ